MPVTKRWSIVVLLLVLLVHASGRIAAISHPVIVDSFIYAIAACRLWQPDATTADLVPDKPPGQAILTGWCYRLAPGEPSRLTLVPIESAFLLGAYLVFYHVARRQYGRRAAGALTLFFALANNTYNALDYTTDGFNLNECYLALPMLLGVLAHLAIRRPAPRGLACGLAVGVALTIKQSAAGLLLALLISEWLTAWRRRRPAAAALAGGTMLAGVGLVCGAVALYLASRGWLNVHLESLARQTAPHAAPPAWKLPRWRDAWDVLAPMLPMIWVLTLGLACRAAARGKQHETENVPAAATAEHDDSPGPDPSALVFFALWLAIELTILAAMTKPSSHYWQQIAAPATLLAGWGWTTIGRTIGQLGATGRPVMQRWSVGTTAVITLVASMPLLAASASRAPYLDLRWEVAEFARRMEFLTPPVHTTNEEDARRDAGN